MLQKEIPCKVGFLLCSNGELDLSEFNGLSVFRPTNHFIEDMYSLAACDYIVGPPSTYSAWASFVGDTPLCVVHNPEDNFIKDDFRVFLEDRVLI
jgi:hypothetical protein